LQSQKQMHMNIRTSILAILVSCVSSQLVAQTSDAEADAIINLLGVKKREAIAKLVYMESKDSAAFWSLYDEYQVQNKSTAKSRIRLYEKTAQAYQSMSAEVADSLARQYFSNRAEQETALQHYYAKIKKATNAVVAFEFYQAEVYILTQIRANIMQQIPTYGELQTMAKKD
jgi:hypothetical protein